MPNPKDYTDKSKFMSDSIKTNIQEGKPRDQAIAISISMWENRNKKKKKKMASELLRELSMRIAFPFRGKEPNEIEKSKLGDIFHKYPKEELKQLLAKANKWWYDSNSLMTKYKDEMGNLVKDFYDKVLKDFVEGHKEDKELLELKKIVTESEIQPAYIVHMIRDAEKESNK